MTESLRSNLDYILFLYGMGFVLLLAGDLGRELARLQAELTGGGGPA